MPIPFQPPDPIYPTWGQSLGGGLDRFVQNYAMARDRQFKEGLMERQLADDTARREAEVANFQAQQGTFLTPGQFTQANAALSAPEGIRAPMAPDLIAEVQRIHQQGRDIQANKATRNVLDLGTGQTTPVSPGTRVVSGGKAPSVKQQYVDEIYSRFKSDPASVSDEEKQIAGIASKRTIISADTAKLIENASSGLRALDQMESAIKEDPNIFRWAQPNAVGRIGAALKGTTGQNYSTAAKTALDIIQRLRTGAQINATEETFYKGLIPRIEDTPESAANKIKQLRDFYGGVVTRLQSGSFLGGGKPQGAVPSGMVRLKSGKMYDPSTGEVK